MKAHLMSGGRYPVLRALGILSVISAGLVAVLGIVGAVWAFVRVTDTTAGKFIAAGASLAGAFILCVWMLAFAEMIKLFIDLEHNTRISAVSHAPSATASVPGDGQPAHVNRIAALDEETAEAALIRGH